MEAVKENLSLLLEMECKMKKTPTCIERDKIRRKNERRVREMKGKKEKKEEKKGTTNKMKGRLGD